MISDQCFSDASGLDLPSHRRTVHLLLHLQLDSLIVRLLARLNRLARPILRVERSLEHLDRGRVRYARSCQKSLGVGNECKVETAKETQTVLCQKSV